MLPSRPDAHRPRRRPIFVICAILLAAGCTQKGCSASGSASATAAPPAFQAFVIDASKSANSGPERRCLELAEAFERMPTNVTSIFVIATGQTVTAPQVIADWTSLLPDGPPPKPKPFQKRSEVAALREQHYRAARSRVLKRVLSRCRDLVATDVSPVLATAELALASLEVAAKEVGWACQRRLHLITDGRDDSRELCGDHADLTPLPGLDGVAVTACGYGQGNDRRVDCDQAGVKAALETILGPGLLVAPTCPTSMEGGE